MSAPKRLTVGVGVNVPCCVELESGRPTVGCWLLLRQREGEGRVVEP